MEHFNHVVTLCLATEVCACIFLSFLFAPPPSSTLLIFQFNKAGTFETVWQAKYYNYYKREHCQFGNKFGSIDYECKPNETRTLMWINKESFN